MSKRIFALVSAILISLSSINYLGVKNYIFQCKLAEKQISFGEASGYDKFLKDYKNKLKELEVERERKKAEENKKVNKIRNLDRDYSGNYRIINVNCILSFYTNSNSKLEGGQYDKRGKLLVSHNMNICAAPSNIPYGSFIELNGMGVYKVVDTGGAIKWLNNNTMKVDIFVPNATNKYLNQLGIKKATGKIYIKTS